PGPGPWAQGPAGEGSPGRGAGPAGEESRAQLGGTMSITLDQVRAEALFAGDLQPSQYPSIDLVRHCVTTLLRRHGVQWCAARMAQEFGDHPEAAARRMSWALRVIQDCYPGSARTRTRCRPDRTRRHTGWVRGDRVARMRCRYRTVGRGERWC